MRFTGFMKRLSIQKVGLALRLSRPFLAFILAAATGIFSACETREVSAKSGGLSDLAKRGRAIYSTQCIACHNSDPHLAGALGPEVFGSSKELLEARILRAEYPAGYKPKRETHSMVPLPHLKPELDAIHAYLN